MYFRFEVEKRERILADEEMEISTNRGTQLYCRVWFAPRALHSPCFHAGGAHRSCSGSESHGHTWLSTGSRKTTPPTAHVLQTPTKPPMGMMEDEGRWAFSSQKQPTGAHRGETPPTWRIKPRNTPTWASTIREEAFRSRVKGREGNENETACITWMRHHLSCKKEHKSAKDQGMGRAKIDEMHRLIMKRVQLIVFLPRGFQWSCVLQGFFDYQ